MAKAREYIEKGEEGMKYLARTFNPKTLAVAGAATLGAAGGLMGQETERDYIVSDNYCNSVTGDGSVLRNLCYDINLTPNSRIDLGDILDLETLSGRNVNYKVLDLEEGLRGVIARIRNGDQTGETQTSIKYYQRLLGLVGTEIQKPDVYSEQRLQRALEDEVIDVRGEGLFNPSARAYHTEDGLYAVLVESEDKDESHYVFLRLRGSPEDFAQPIQPETRPEGQLGERVDVDEAFDVFEGIPQPEIDLAGEPDYLPGITSEDRRARRADRVATRFSIGAMRNFEDTERGLIASSGVGSLSVFAGITQSDDKTLERLNVPLNNGRLGRGTTERIDESSLMAGLEFHPGYFVLGAGVEKDDYTLRVNERIEAANGDVLASSSNSKTKSEFNKIFYGGVDIPLTRNLGVKALIGQKISWDNLKKENFGSLGVSFRTHRSQDRGNR